MVRWRIVRVLLAFGLAAACTSCGPRMHDQIAIQPHEQGMPPMPAGAVPTSGRLDTIAAEQAASMRSRAEDVAAGRVYYGYYCLMCHGANGDGNGPVGQSYVPKPTDLTSATVARLTGGQIHIRMLRGVGHDPVMIQTVPAGQRWPIVAYVRALKRGRPL